MVDNKQDRGLRYRLGRLFGGKAGLATGRNAEVPLYRDIVAAARQPRFYAEWGVPDTTDGRREMIGLHAILVMRRLRDGGAEGARLSQRLFDLMFADFDRNFREQGVGDLSVGKHVKRAASTFLARYEFLDRALDKQDRTALNDLLLRNLFMAETAPPKSNIGGLSDHLCDLDKRLGAVPVNTLIEGRMITDLLQPPLR